MSPCSSNSSILRNGGDHNDDRRYPEHVLPWYKSPSPLWPLVLLPFITSAVSATFAPRIEVYTQLVCAAHKPDISKEYFPFSVAATSHCTSDPAVQAKVAKLSAVITACAGILACITTGWWGAFSDRHGRTRVMGITVAGLFLTDINFILTSHFWRHLPGGYWSLAIGPIIEGCLGGIVAAAAALNAYLADTTTPAIRSRFFSLSLGLTFAGMSLGPTLGSLLIRATGHTLSVFYVDGVAHLFFALCILFLVPESRPLADRCISRAKYSTENTSGTIWRRIFSFLIPLSVFWPASASARGFLKVRRSWALLLIAMSYGLAISVTETFNVKFQYTSATFGWSSETNGYWLSLVGAARASFLTLVLPVVIKLFTPHPAPAPSLSASPSSCTLSETQPLLHSSDLAPFSFELRLAQASLLIELTAYTLMAFARTPRVFILASLFDAIGAGFGPAVQTVALGMFLRGNAGGRGGGESGRLFGGLGVVQALCSEILGPAGYGFVYMKTAGMFPRAIFLVSLGMVGLALGLLTFAGMKPDGGAAMRVAEEDVVPIQD